MTWNEIIKTNIQDDSLATKIIAALDKLFKNDAYLFEVDVNERTLSHRFALYLTSQFETYDVDCEYNRDGHEPKTLTISRPSRNTRRRCRTSDSNVYPDIIIHRRGDNSNNLLVIEIKKSTSTETEDWDLKKLETFLKELNYTYGLFICFVCKDKPELRQVRWYQK